MSYQGMSVTCPVVLAMASLSLVFSGNTQANVNWSSGTYHVSNISDDDAIANENATVFLESNVLLAGELQIMNNSHVTLNDTCNVEQTVYVRDISSSFVLNGGTVGNLVLQGKGDATLNSGTIESSLRLYQGDVLMRGGTYYGDEIECGIASELTLEGYEFTVNGIEIANGSQMSFAANGDYAVTGTLADGSTVNFTVNLASAVLNFNANAVPGPVGGMLGLAALVVCPRRRRRL